MSELGHRWVPAPERAHLPRDVSKLCSPHGDSDRAANRALRAYQSGGVDVALRQLASAQLQELPRRQLRWHLLAGVIRVVKAGSSGRTGAAAPGAPVSARASKP